MAIDRRGGSALPSQTEEEKNLMNKTKLKGTCKTAPQLLVTTKEYENHFILWRRNGFENRSGSKGKGRRWETGTLECGKDTAVLK